MHSTEVTCNMCDAEFEIVPANADAHAPVEYCPFCGSILENTELDANDFLSGEDWED